MLEELLALGYSGAEYDAWLIRITEGEQFGSGFVAINPNSKIPALMDRSGPTPIRVFESGAILLYLAEKFRAFLPTDTATRAECVSWLFWQMGSAPYLGGGFGHFYAYAPAKIEYAIDRYAMEAKRQLDVLDRRLAQVEYLAGSNYTIADMAVWPWYGALAKGALYDAGVFLQVQELRARRSVGPTRSPRAPLCSEGARSTAPGASSPVSCTSGTTPETSRPRRKTRSQLIRPRPADDSGALGRRRLCVWIIASDTWMEQRPLHGVAASLLAARSVAPAATTPSPRSP